MRGLVDIARLHRGVGLFLNVKNEETIMTKSKELSQDIQLEETLMEFCASEATMGAIGEKNEAGFGKYDDV